MLNAVAAVRPVRVSKSETTKTPKSGDSYVEFSSSQDNACIWTTSRASAPAHVSLQLLQELAGIAARVRQGRFGIPRFRMLASNIQGIFSLGGDLGHFLEKIEYGDRNGLFDYAKAAIDEVWTNITGFGIPGLVTVALVEGEAQGGGFEAALSCHVMVAEQGTHFGFPESLFGLFPGMGAALLLRARVDEEVAERIISRPTRFSAEFLQEIGVVDYVVPKGTGRTFVETSILNSATTDFSLLKRRFDSIRYQALLDSVEEWVERAMTLSDKHRRSMRYLLNAQKRAYGDLGD